MYGARIRWNVGVILYMQLKRKPNKKHNAKRRKNCIRWIKPEHTAMIYFHRIKSSLRLKALFAYELPKRQSHHRSVVNKKKQKRICVPESSLCRSVCLCICVWVNASKAAFNPTVWEHRCTFSPVFSAVLIVLTRQLSPNWGHKRLQCFRR